MPTKHNCTKEEKEALYLVQKGSCKICGTSLKKTGRLTHVDHCHTSGETRGLLCRSCNHGLGLFKDNPVILQNAARYIAEHRTTSGWWRKFRTVG